MHEMGVKVVLAAPSGQSIPDTLGPLCLSLPISLHPVLDPLSVARGFNPDQPVNLKKVTETQ